MWSCKITRQTKMIISPLPQCLWSPHLLRWWYTYKASITWSYKVTWQTKTIISLLQECIWQTNLAEWWLSLMGSYWLCHITLWEHGLVIRDSITGDVSARVVFTYFLLTFFGPDSKPPFFSNFLLRPRIAPACF